MKAIYLTLGEKVYRLNQDTRVPSILEYIPTESKSSINTDEALKTVVETISLSTMETSGIKSNGQLFKDFKDYLRNKKITQIYNIYDRYKIAIDYSLNNGICDLSRNIVIKDMSFEDAAILLGVGTNSECVYRRVKDIRSKLEFGITVPVPLGITSPGTKQYRLQIHDISFYVDTQPYTGNLHNSIYQTPYGCAANKTTIHEDLKDYALIYSTAVEGLRVQDLVIPFMPRKVSLDILLTYDNLIVAYDDMEVNKIVEDNIKNKYHHHDPENPDPVDPEGIVIPDTDNLPDADGCTKPDRHGWYDYWERCNATSPHARLVVEDLTPDSVYDQKAMVKRKKILKDIPDIEIGEYVHYVEAIEDDPITHHSCPVHHHCDCNNDDTSTDNTEDNTDIEPTPTVPDDEVVDTSVSDSDSTSTDPQADEINSLFDRLGSAGSNASGPVVLSVDEVDV